MSHESEGIAQFGLSGRVPPMTRTHLLSRKSAA